MSRRIYSDRCPVHQSVLKTDRTKKFCLKRSGPIYDAPIYFCDRCKTYYVFIKELDASFKGSAKESDGNPIKVLGTKPSSKSVKEIRKITSAPKTGTKEAKQKPSDSKINQNKKGIIVRSIDDGALSVNIIPSGMKVPKSCLKCGVATSSLIFKVVDVNGKEKQLVGKECPSCGRIYYTELIINQHPKYFRLVGTLQEQKKSEKKETPKSIVDEKTKDDIDNSSSQKSEENQEQREKREVFSTFCPEHDIVLRTPVMWKPSIPLFSCPQCGKYYISSNIYPYGSVVERIRTRPVLNVDLVVSRGPEPEHGKNENIEEQIDSENWKIQGEINDDKSVSSSVNLDIDSDSKAVPDEKGEDLKVGEAENEGHTIQNAETSNPKKDLRIPDNSQRQILGMGNIIGRKICTDDFGEQYDFTELESILML